MRRLTTLRAVMAERELDAFVVPRSDAYLNEDLAPADERLAWLTGFSGSVGLAVITRERAALLVDGRYTVQAAVECGARLEVLALDDASLFEWLGRHLGAGARIGCDPTLHSIDEYSRWQRASAGAGFAWCDVIDNPLDPIWLERPPAPASPVVIQPLEFAGLSATDKLAQLTRQLLAADCSALWLPAPDMLAWLLNVRAEDIAIAPLPFSCALLHATGELDWFIDAQRLQLPPDWLPPTVRVRPVATLASVIQRLADAELQRVWLDRASCNAAIYRQFQHTGWLIHEAPHPLLLLRACKQAAELQGSRQAHVLDGLALCRFIHDFEKHCERFVGQSELAVAESLHRWRQMHPDYRGVSFDTIAATGANGAQPHYLPKPGQAAKLKRGELLLIDSGGQYPQGTTDVTRVLACSAPTPRQRYLYTTVLRAHIALASCIFPKGTCGQQLDNVARQVMWREGLDYAHGTGHGVGSYLQVHEGPHRIAPRASGVALQAGMITSIEPGVYMPDELGIRIENLYEVVEVPGHPQFLGFQVLTLAPMSGELIERGLLNVAEAQWLDAYQAHVWRTLAEQLEPAVGAWLQRQVSPNNLLFGGQ